MDFGSLELPLKRLGRHLGIILEVLGCCGGPFWGSGGGPGRLRRAMAFKDPWCHLGPRHFERFWCSKGAHRATKIVLNSLTNGLKNRSTFWFDFSSVSEAFLHDFRKGFQTLDLQR